MPAPHYEVSDVRLPESIRPYAVAAATRFNQLRMALGYSNSELGRLLLVGDDRIKRYATGATEVPAWILLRLEDALKASGGGAAIVEAADRPQAEDSSARGSQEERQAPESQLEAYGRQIDELRGMMSDLLDVVQQLQSIMRAQLQVQVEAGRGARSSAPSDLEAIEAQEPRLGAVRRQLGHGQRV